MRNSPGPLVMVSRLRIAGRVDFGTWAGEGQRLARAGSNDASHHPSAQHLSGHSVSKQCFARAPWKFIPDTLYQVQSAVLSRYAGVVSLEVDIKIVRSAVVRLIAHGLLPCERVRHEEPIRKPAVNLGLQGVKTGGESLPEFGGGYLAVVSQIFRLAERAGTNEEPRVPIELVDGIDAMALYIRDIEHPTGGKLALDGDVPLNEYGFLKFGAI